MLTSYRQNTHRSVLPALGAIGCLPSLVGPRRCIVESFPLSDAADQRYSRGIHTCVVRFLDNGERRRVSGFWFCQGEE